MATQQTPPEQLPLFYKKVVPLSKERHGGWFIDSITGYEFTRAANTVYIAGIEFNNAAKDLPIVFSADKVGVPVPLALLGVRDKENLLLDEKGNWDGGYIPAYIRRYPFILASGAGNEGDRYTVCIDESYAGFNTVGEGERIMDKDGEQGKLLEKSFEFLREYQANIERTTMFCKTMQELGLLDPIVANVELAGGDKFTIGGFMCIKRDQLNELSGDTLKDLVANGYMELIYAHLGSLGNLNRLITKMKK